MKLTDPQITECEGVKGNWVLTADFTYKGHGVSLTLPRGFLTDLASIPRALWWLIAPFELSLTAPIIHDWFYRNAGRSQGNTLTREETDRLFLAIMEDEGISWWRRTAAFRGVRLFGGSSWGATKPEVVNIEGGAA